MFVLLVSCKKDKQIEPLYEERFTNLSYGSDSLQTIDIKLPANRDEKTPVVFLFHGGGWVIGKKEDMSLFEDVFFKKGFAVVSVNYRLANSLVHYNEINTDIIASVNYIDSHLKEYHISNRKYSMLGFSACAQLAMLYAYKSNNIKAVVSIAGPNNLYNPFYQQGYITTSIESYTGYTYGTNSPALIILLATTLLQRISCMEIKICMLM
jgi:acetyl esterase/lipase